MISHNQNLVYIRLRTAKEYYFLLLRFYLEVLRFYKILFVVLVAGNNVQLFYNEIAFIKWKLLRVA